MVLEKLVPEAWLERKPGYGLLLGVGYAVIGIMIAAIIFRKDPAIPSVAFTSLFLIPIVRKIFLLEEIEKSKDRKFNWKTLYAQNKDVFLTYFFIFFGIFIVYSAAATLLPSFQVNKLFREQLGMKAGAATGFAVSDLPFNLEEQGQAIVPGSSETVYFHPSLFLKLLSNNWWVLFATLVIALLAGEGGIFFITWNASVWGTAFGVLARNAAIFDNASSLWYLIIVLGIVFPHMFLEIGSYILAGISGSIFSVSLGKEKFSSPKMKYVFLYCSGLLLIALLFLFFGALFETYVLVNNETYQTMIMNGLRASILS